MKSSLLRKESKVNIATLKAELAKYLRLVKAGEEVTVLDHKLPVAKIVPIELKSVRPLESILPKADFSGIGKMKVPPLEKKPKVNSLTLLLEDRDSR